MPISYDGGCLCGELRYQITGNPITVYICHCTECQKIASSAFGMSVRVNENDFNITQGNPEASKTVADSGRSKVGYFCPKCGIRIYGKPSSGGIVVVKGGTLDNPNWFKPVAHIWTRSALNWFPFIDELKTYEKAPEDTGELNRLWLERIN